MKVIHTILGFLFFPFVWTYDRLIRGNPSSPPEFWLYIRELHKNGIPARLQMQSLPIEGVSKSAIVTLEPGRSAFNVVNLFKCVSVEAANRILTELNSNPGMSHSRQRDRYLMSVTFTEIDEELAATVTDVFQAFELPPDTSGRPHRQQRRTA